MCVCVCADRRKDCLRQFIVVLYERRELDLLVNLTYRDKHVVLEGEVGTAPLCLLYAASLLCAVELLTTLKH